MADPFAPCDLVEHEPGSYSLMFMEMEPLSEGIQKQGGSGGGYSWESMVKAVLEMRSVVFTDLEFDPESDMFSVASSDKKALQTVASIVRQLTEDPGLVTRAISHAKSRGYFA
jgi:hypothetical protein